MLKPYEDFVVEPLAFPIGNKVYTLEPYDIPTGLRLTEVVSHQDPEFDKLPTSELYKLLLGPLWDEMIADGVTLAAVSRCGLTALTDFQYGRKMAEGAWERGADPKAISAYLVKNLPRAQRRSRNTGGANLTRSQGSTRGTTSRKK
jgi:hypothetical protein